MPPIFHPSETVQDSVPRLTSAKRRRTDPPSTSPLAGFSSVPTNDRPCRNSGCRFRGPDEFFLDNKRGNRIFLTCVTCRAFDHALRRYRADDGDEADLDHPTLCNYIQTWLRAWTDQHQPLLGRRNTNTEIAGLAREKIESEFPPRTPASARRVTRSTQPGPTSLQNRISSQDRTLLPGGNGSLSTNNRAPDEQHDTATYSVPASGPASSAPRRQGSMLDRRRTESGGTDRESLANRGASPHGTSIKRDAALTGRGRRRIDSSTSSLGQPESTASTLDIDEEEEPEELDGAPSENNMVRRVRPVSPELGSFSAPPVESQSRPQGPTDEQEEAQRLTSTDLCLGIANSLHKIARGFERLADRSPDQQRFVLDMMGLDWDEV